MLVVLSFDTVLFITGGFVESPDYARLLVSGILGKGVAALLYSAALTFYLRVFEREQAPLSVTDSHIRDVFHLLTFREKYQVLQEQIKRDPLTGIYNRGFFNDILPRELSLAGRMRFPLALIMLDIDRFKRVNDQYGHRTGDVVLQEMAALLGRSIRASDILCRYGGEEFAILLPNTACSDALALAQKLRRALRTQPLAQRLLAKGRTITVTMGVAAYPEDASSPEALVESADQRLYRGKQAGRDRVVGPPSY
jgi:diguanylate cyclase (GGDEF)-like protein